MRLLSGLWSKKVGIQRCNHFIFVSCSFCIVVGAAYLLWDMGMDRFCFDTEKRANIPKTDMHCEWCFIEWGSFGCILIFVMCKTII